MSSDEKHIMYFIGYNLCGEFGLGHNNSSMKLIACSSKSITKVFPSEKYSIYSNDNYSQIFAAGSNRHGQCGVGHNQKMNKFQSIKYFNKHNIKIEKICTNVSGRCTFFISDKHQLYACGNNYKDYFFAINDPSNQNVPILIHH